MTRLSELRLQDFRNFDHVSLSLSPGINIILGDNGAGKTSILEAISVLASGRSFRRGATRGPIRDGQVAFSVFAKGDADLAGSVSPIDFQLGIQRTRGGKFQGRLNGEEVRRAAQLAENLPLMFINSDSLRLLADSPNTRRQFFDWLVFHVKHSFADDFSGFQRLLRHRNSLLRRPDLTYSELGPWDLQLASSSAKLSRARFEVFSKYQDGLAESLAEAEFEKRFGGKIETLFDHGFGGDPGEPPPEIHEILELLKSRFDKDRERGHTTMGPHRADLEFRITTGEGRQLKLVERLSSGQSRLFVLVLFYVQIALLKSEVGRSTVLLLDDVLVELDESARRQTLKDLLSLDIQTLVAMVEEDPLVSELCAFQGQSPTMFHVKHGTINQ